MKKRTILSAFMVVFLLQTCTQLAPQNDKQMARAERVNGLLVFIHSKPVAQYSVIGRLQHDAVAEALGAGQGKKFGKALGDILNKTLENMSLREQVYKMTELAKQQNPQAEALIINDKIFEAEVIRFN